MNWLPKIGSLKQIVGELLNEKGKEEEEIKGSNNQKKRAF